MATEARTTRPLAAADLEQSHALGIEAFGVWPAGTPAPTAADFPGPGRHPWGTFEDGRLVAKVVGRELHSWFRGAPVATCGVAGVAVAAEHRGSGLLLDLVAALLEEGAARGEVVSTLFPTAPGIYRRLGYELIGSYDTLELPTAALATVRPAAGVTLRRATGADVPLLRQAYAAWAARQNGPLTRSGASFPAGDALREVTGTTVALDAAGEVVGYASWDRGAGYDAAATLTVPDLVALTPDAARALWRTLGSFGSVTGQVRLTTSGLDPARLVLPFHAGEVVARHPYMLRVHDVTGALSALPLAGAADVRFRVSGDPFGSDGDYRLVVGDGATTCTRAAPEEGAAVLTPQGLALMYAGAQSCANLRLAGHLHAGSPEVDAVLDALLGGRQVHIRDYF